MVSNLDHDYVMMQPELRKISKSLLTFSFLEIKSNNSPPEAYSRITKISEGVSMNS